MGLLRIGVTRADLKHCGKMSGAREEKNRSVREWRIEFRHPIKILEGMESRSHNIGSELRMHFLPVDCTLFQMKKKLQ